MKLISEAVRERSLVTSNGSFGCMRYSSACLEFHNFEATDENDGA